MKLELRGLSKSYGSLEALKPLDIVFTPGVHGILGPNGAGKSTLLNLLATNLKPTSGAIFLNQKDIASMRDFYRQKIGYMPQMQKLYDSFTARRFLSYIAALKGLNSSQTKSEVARVLELVRLTSRADDRLHTFSGGMRQRVLIASCLIDDPEILILDEPTAGLDPLEIIRIRNMIAEIAGARIVLIASHIIAAVEHIATRILLINNGYLVANDAPSRLLERFNGQVVEVVVSADRYDELKGKYRISSIRNSRDGLLVRIIGDVDEVLKPRAVYPTLQDLYLSHFATEYEEP